MLGQVIKAASATTLEAESMTGAFNTTMSWFASHIFVFTCSFMTSFTSKTDFRR